LGRAEESGSDDYEREPLVEAAVPEFNSESRQLGNEARFVPAAHGVGSESLSRVEMNALWAPLTALPNLLRARVCLTEADDFIDGDKSPYHKLRAGKEKLDVCSVAFI
jgi:hypothetical protein